MAAAGVAVTGVVVAGVNAAAARPTRGVATAQVTTPAVPLTHASTPPAPAAALPQLALHCRATARACVDLRHRLAWLQDDAGRVVFGPVHTGITMPGHRTPRGQFRVAWKAPHWVSTEYGIPMPWSVFFAPGGIAFHAGPLTEPSHGCVHLTPSAAHHFFDALAVGDRVDVH